MNASRTAFAWSQVLCIVLVLIVCFSPRVQAADDSNSGNLATAQTINNQQLNATISVLSQNLNNSQAKQLVSQLQSQIAQGNVSGEASTLAQLKNLINENNTGMSSSFQDLLKSMYVGNNGLTIDPNLLASLLGSINANGVPSGLAGESPQQSSSDLVALASLLKGIDPSLAQQLLTDASMIDQGQAVQGDNGNLQVPKAGNIPVPKPPSPFSAGPPKLPSTNLILMMVIPIIIVGVGLGLYFSRARIGATLGRRIIPFAGAPEDTSIPDYNPADPRGRIIYYFHRAVQVMRLRGVSKLTSETHREFEAKCAERIEAPDVSGLSTLYERAKFSGQDIVSSEADDAATHLSNITEIAPK